MVPFLILSSCGEAEAVRVIRLLKLYVTFLAGFVLNPFIDPPEVLPLIGNVTISPNFNVPCDFRH